MSEWRVIQGDCLEVMRGMDANSVDSIVTDPPYGLEFMGKEWDRLDFDGRDRSKALGNSAFEPVCGSGLPTPRIVRGQRRKCSVCGKWSGGTPNMLCACKAPVWLPSNYGQQMQDWHYRWAIEALRVAKPGCIMLAFGGTRTHHRLACAIEDAGWEIRDTVMWVYGSGFPKSLDISKAIDKAAGAEREVVGVSNPHDPRGAAKYRGDSGIFATGRSPEGVPITAPATDLARLWQGWGTALKPAWEPIIVAMKPLDGTFAQNAERHGVAGLCIDGCRVGTEGGETHRGGYQDAMVGGKVARGGVDTDLTPKGRWPANLIHDGSEEVLAGFPVTKSGVAVRRNGNQERGTFPVKIAVGSEDVGYNDTGSAARFFQCCPPDGEEVRRLYYCAKASRAERELGLEGMEERDARVTGMQADQGMPFRMESGVATNPKAPPIQSANHHPTVKPLALMRYLVRLTKTPTGGLVLDPFMGSGTTGVACVMEGRDFVGIELSEEYCAIARARIAEAAMQGVLL